MLELGRFALCLSAVVALPGWASAQPAMVFAMVCRGAITGGSELQHTRATRPWSSRILVDLQHKIWRQDGGQARPLVDWSVDGASLTVFAEGGDGFASSIRWVNGDGHYVGIGDPSLTMIKAACTAESPTGRPLALPPAR